MNQLLLHLFTGKLAAFDQDVGQILSFTLLNYTDVFMLKGDNSLATITSLDYEVQPIYAVSVKCTDDGGDPKFVSLVLYTSTLIIIEGANIKERMHIYICMLTCKSKEKLINCLSNMTLYIHVY